MTSGCFRTLVMILCFAFVGVDSALSDEARTARPLSRETLKVVALQFNASGKTREERVVAALKLLERAAEAEGPAV